MASPTKIAIAGFSGRVARLTTGHLLQHDNVEIHGICRSAAKVDSSLRSKDNVKIFEATSTDVAALREALRGTSVCICCYLGDDNLMFEGQKTLIDACIAEGVPRYVASDYSLDFRGLDFRDHPSKDPMKHVQAYLEEKEKDGKMKGVHILNGAFTEIVWASFTDWVNTEDDTFRYYGTGDEPIEMTTYDDAAKFTAEVALDPNATGFLNVLGDRKSIKELAALYQEAYDVTPQVQRVGSLDDLHRKMSAASKEQPENPYAWIGMHYQYYMQNGSTLLGKLDNKKYLQREPTSVAMFLKKYNKESVGKSAFM